MLETQSVFLAFNSHFFESIQANEKLSEVAGRLTKDALARALRKIREGGPDWFVYENGDPRHDRVEDQGRTQIIHIQGLPEKVYAILEDYGDPTKWPEMYEPETVADLRKALGDKRHQLTILFASDY